MEYSDFDTETLISLIRERGMNRVVRLVRAHFDDGYLSDVELSDVLERLRFLHAALMIPAGIAR